MSAETHAPQQEFQAIAVLRRWYATKPASRASPRYKRYQFNDGRHPPDTAGSVSWLRFEGGQSWKRLMILAAFGRDREAALRHGIAAGATAPLRKPSARRSID